MVSVLEGFVLVFPSHAANDKPTPTTKSSRVKNITERGSFCTNHSLILTQTRNTAYCKTLQVENKQKKHEKIRQNDKRAKNMPFVTFSERKPRYSNLE
ncbi:hypothetical protein [Fibrobacter sp.]|uniref:hypothetical protein n=1 Tax=Fibrobacter sp. TaxID=35828 RepID=UPI00388E2888